MNTFTFFLITRLTLNPFLHGQFSRMLVREHALSFLAIFFEPPEFLSCLKIEGLISFYLSICRSVYLSICLSICLAICLSICLSVCLSVYLRSVRKALKSSAKCLTIDSIFLLTNCFFMFNSLSAGLVLTLISNLQCQSQARIVRLMCKAGAREMEHA